MPLDNSCVLNIRNWHKVDLKKIKASPTVISFLKPREKLCLFFVEYSITQTIHYTKLKFCVYVFNMSEFDTGMLKFILFGINLVSICLEVVKRIKQCCRKKK